MRHLGPRPPGGPRAAHEVRAEWKRWAPEHLPLLPDHWPLVVLPDTKAQFGLVAAILRAPSIERVVCATDAGREGELIFRYVYEKAGCRKPVRRLWLSSLTPEAIRQGFERLRAGSDFEPLADAARGRSRADWLVGMNLSRATTLGHGETLHVGRVQTPTLALLVEREKAIRGFVPEDYLEVVATFGAGDSRYEGSKKAGSCPELTLILGRTRNCHSNIDVEDVTRCLALAPAGLFGRCGPPEPAAGLGSAS